MMNGSLDIFVASNLTHVRSLALEPTATTYILTVLPHANDTDRVIISRTNEYTDVLVEEVRAGTPLYQWRTCEGSASNACVRFDVCSFSLSLSLSRQPTFQISAENGTVLQSTTLDVSEVSYAVAVPQENSIFYAHSQVCALSAL